MLRVSAYTAIFLMNKDIKENHVYNDTRGADKSLARPGRTQATATKLGINSTYSPRSSNTLLSPLLKLFQATQKKS